MNPIEAIRTRVGRRFSDFKEVTELRFFLLEEPGRDPVPVIELTIRTEDKQPLTALALRCLGVQDFHLSDFGGGPTRINGFTIESLHDRQLERIRWEVRDYENGMLGFVCSDLEVRVAPV